VFLRSRNLSQQLDKWVLVEVFDWLIMAEYVEALHRTGKDAFRGDMNLAETEEVLGSEDLVDLCIVAYQVLKFFGTA
jgi:hypothetical protein